MYFYSIMFFVMVGKYLILKRIQKCTRIRSDSIDYFSLYRG